MAIGKKKGEKKRKRSHSYNTLKNGRNREEALHYIDVVNLIDRSEAAQGQVKRRRISNSSAALTVQSDFIHHSGKNSEKFVQRKRKGSLVHRKRMVGYDREDLTEVVRAIVMVRKHYIESEGLSESQVLQGVCYSHSGFLRKFVFDNRR